MNGGTDLGLGVMVSMKDAFSNNSARVENSMRSLDATVAASSENIQRNMDRIQKGAMTMGAGLAMMALPLGLVASTAATQKALGELKSLGVQDLQALEDAAESFTNQWSGTTKAEFISASYDVRSAISTLSDEAVGTLTAMAALTAKATKATTEEMVGTFTTGYGIFKPLMKDLSDEQWAKTFAGAMAQTVASFKTNGKQMADAIKNIGAVAAANNVPLEEQLAILGQLQTTMPGSEAGTLYKAFIMKAAEAGEALGLDFLNSQGQLKGVLGMMDEIKKKFPDLSKAAAQVEIKKAFGSDEAVKFLLQMSQGTEALEGNIKTIQGAMKTGTAVTEKMAEAMNMDIGSQFAVLGQQIRNLSEIMGRTLLPVVTPIIQGLSRVILFFQKVAKSVPGLTRVVLVLSMALGAVLVVVGGVIAAAGTIGIMLPAIKAGLLAMAGAAASVGGAMATWFLPVTAIIAGVVLAVYLLKRAWESDFAGIRSTVMGFFNKIGLVFQGIRALIGSLSGGSASMSADLAKKLEAAGLMGLVTTVFRIYYRVREFMAGLWNAFSSAFGKIRKMLEPAVSALVDAFAGLWKALFSIFEAFGLVSTAADGSAFRGFGQVLGTVLGVMAQVAGFMLSNLAYGLATIAYLITPIIKAVVWLVKVIVQGAVLAAKFLYKFFLPLRLLVQGFKMVAKVAYALWQMITGDISVTDGFKKIGGAVFDFLATPFLWVRDVVVGVWNGLKWTFTAIGNFLMAAGSLMVSAFMNFPLVRMFRDMFGTIAQFMTGEIDFYECGKRILLTLGEGILSTLLYPFSLLKKAFAWVRKLLPFSDAQTGPLSSLTDSGAAILKTLGKGMMAVLGLPAQLLGTAFNGMMKAASWVWGGLKKIGSGILSAVSAPFKVGAELAGKAWDGIKDAASSAWSGMKSAASTAWGWMKSGFSGLASVAAGAWDGIKSGAVAAWDGIKSASSTVGEWLKAPLEGLSSFATGVWGNMKSLAGSAWSSITGLASSAWDGMKSMAASAGDWLSQPFDALTNVAAPAWEKMKDFASGAWEGMKTKMSEVATSAYDSRP